MTIFFCVFLFLSYIEIIEAAEYPWNPTDADIIAANNDVLGYCNNILNGFNINEAYNYLTSLGPKAGTLIPSLNFKKVNGNNVKEPKDAFTIQSYISYLAVPYEGDWIPDLYIPYNVQITGDAPFINNYPNSENNALYVYFTTNGNEFTAYVIKESSGWKILLISQGTVYKRLWVSNNVTNNSNLQDIHKENYTFIAVNGNIIIFPDQKPYADENNRIMVPVRFPSEVLGANVAWLQDTQQVHIVNKVHDSLQDANIMVTLNNQNVIVNGKNETMDTTAVSKNERTMVPVRFISEYLGATVTWDDRNGIAHVFSKGQTPYEQKQIMDDVAKEVKATQVQ